MKNRRSNRFIFVLLMLILGGIACEGGPVDDFVGRMNASATRAAGGIEGAPTVDINLDNLFPTVDPNTLPTEEPTLANTAEPERYLVDLTVDPNTIMANGWGRTYAQPSGTPFKLIATQRQVGDYIILTLKLEGYETYVRGGNATVGAGQIRLDLALVGEDSSFGAGTITFQPTLDTFSLIKTNPLGGSFGSLPLPAELYPSIGDAVYTVLTGASNDALSRVTLTSISLVDGIMTVEGTVR